MVSNDNVIDLRDTIPSSRSRYQLIAARLTEARFAKRMTQTDLARAIGVSRQAVSAYELDAKRPEPSTMMKIAETLEQPISFFTREVWPDFGTRSALFFRKIGPDTRRRNRACEVYANWAISSAAIFDDLVNYPSVDLPRFEPADSESLSYDAEEIENAAEATRKHFGLGWGPISNVLRLIESKGVVTCRLAITDDSIEAFSYWSGARPFVFLASEKESAARARFDVAHELGHLCLHRWVGAEEIENKERLDEIESEANRFAGAFLLPRRSFPNEIYSPRAESFVDLKARWKVAIQAMIFRCKDLHLFDGRQITNLYKQISYKKWRTKEPLDGPNGLPIEQPMLLQHVAQMVFESGHKDKADLITELAIAPHILEQLLGMRAGSLSGESREIHLPSLT